MADKIKLGIALLLVIAGVAGFYLLSAYPMVVRVLAVLGGIGLALLVAWLSEPGKRFLGFSKESVAEAKKVVWPTRKEAMQTTLVVFALVVVVAIFLWVVDATLFWGVRLLMGQGD